MENVWQAREVCEGARASVEQARATDAQAQTDAPIAAAPNPSATLPTSREALLRAEERVAAAEAARDAINAEIGKLEAGASSRDAQVNDGIAAVLQAEASGAISALATELDQMHRRLIDGHYALAALIRANAIPRIDGGRCDHRHTPVGDIAYRVEQFPLSWELGLKPSECPTVTAWQAAIKALATDAPAPLPAYVALPKTTGKVPVHRVTAIYYRDFSARDSGYCRNIRNLGTG
jgi:hypothetical protein